MKCLIAFILIYSGSVFGKEIVVSLSVPCQEDERCFESVQAAVDSADSGDTIIVSPGLYEEYVVIDVEGLSLRAQFPAYENGQMRAREQRSIIRFQAAEKNTGLLSGPNGVRIQSDSVHLEGFQIEANNDVVVVAKDCLTRLDSVVIRNNLIKTLSQPLDSKAPGIYSCNSQRLLIENNIILGAKGRQGHAIHLGRLREDSFNAFNKEPVIQRNIISGPMQSGIYGHIESALISENIFYMKNEVVPVINLLGPNSDIENRPTWIFDNRYNSNYFLNFENVREPFLKDNKEF